MPRKIKPALVNIVEGDLIGTADRDVFVLRHGDGDKVVSGFEAGSDRVLFDEGGAYSDIMFLGPLYDGLSFDNFIGTAHFSVHALDANGDGITDTLINANSDSIILLGVAPDSLTGASLMGG